MRLLRELTVGWSAFEVAALSGDYENADRRTHIRLYISMIVLIGGWNSSQELATLGRFPWACEIKLFRAGFGVLRETLDHRRSRKYRR